MAKIFQGLGPNGNLVMETGCTANFHDNKNSDDDNTNHMKKIHNNGHKHVYDNKHSHSNHNNYYYEY